MSESGVSRGYGLYLRIWGILLGLTLVMVAIDRAALPWVLLVVVLIGAMLAKASLIAGYFMHLRFEGRLLVWTVILGLGLLAAILYGLIVPDGLRIHQMVSAP